MKKMKLVYAYEYIMTVSYISQFIDITDTYQTARFLPIHSPDFEGTLSFENCGFVFTNFTFLLSLIHTTNWTK